MKGDSEIGNGDEAAKCLMLLSKVGLQNDSTRRAFSCKTCAKEFSSFQALGGHRASHKTLTASVVHERGCGARGEAKRPPKTTAHECPICGAEFPMGQALGGHMRRHRRKIDGVGNPVTKSLLPSAPVPVAMKKSSSSKRILCLDLALGPLDNVDLSLGLGRTVF